MVIDMSMARDTLLMVIIGMVYLLHRHQASEDQHGLEVEMSDQILDFHLDRPPQITITMAPEANDQRTTDLDPVILIEDLHRGADQEDPMWIPIFQAMVQMAEEEMIVVPETETTDHETEDVMIEMIVPDMIVTVTGIDWIMMIVEVEELAAAVEVLFQTVREEIEQGSESRCLEATLNGIFIADN